MRSIIPPPTSALVAPSGSSLPGASASVSSSSSATTKHPSGATLASCAPAVCAPAVCAPVALASPLAPPSAVASSSSKRLKAVSALPPSSVSPPARLPTSSWTWDDVTTALPAVRFPVPAISPPPLVHRFLASVHGGEPSLLLPSHVSPDCALLTGKVIQRALFAPNHFHAEVRVGYVMRKGPAGVWFYSGLKVCLKTVPLVQLRASNGDTMQELEMMRYLHRDGDAEGRSVVRCLEAVQTPDDFVMVLQFFEGGDLLDRLRAAEHHRFSESDACLCFCSILRALVFLQKKDVFLRDLSIENIMVHDGRAVIIDLGMAVRVPRDPDTGRRKLVARFLPCGKPQCIAPEVFSGAPAVDGFKIDVWAAATVLFTMLVGDRPFNAPDPIGDDWFAMVSAGRFKAMLETRRVVMSSEAAELLERMFVVDPATRLTSVEEIAASDFVRKYGGHLQL